MFKINVGKLILVFNTILKLLSAAKQSFLQWGA